MRLPRTHLTLALAVLACAAVCRAQVVRQTDTQTQRSEFPNIIQFFMPDGSRPENVMRFTLTRDDGRVESVFTDSKGRYVMSSDFVKDTGYTVYVETDRQSYATTTYSFRIYLRNTSSYFSVFLRPLRPPTVPRAGVVEAAALDANIPEAARLAYEEGVGLVQRGETAAGVESFERAVGIYPKYLRALNDLGVAYLQLNRLEEAADAFRRALKVSSRYSYARLNLGIALSRQGNHAEAAKLLGDLFKEYPSLAGARAAYADELYEAGRLAEAEKVLRAGLDDRQLSLGDVSLKDEEKAALRYRLGRVLSREGEYDEAIKELRRARALQPTAFGVHLLLGDNMMRINRLPEAERALLRAYELGGKGAAQAQFLLGQLYSSQQKNDLALRAFEQYLSDAPAAQNAAQAREMVARLKGAPPK